MSAGTGKGHGLLLKAGPGAELVSEMRGRAGMEMRVGLGGSGPS